MLSDWESDLTELSETDGVDEEEYVPPSQRKKTKKRDTGAEYKVYHVQPSLFMDTHPLSL